MKFDYHSALDNYDFDSPDVTFLRHNENIVYQVEDDQCRYLLRIHKPVDGFSLKLHTRSYPFRNYILSEMKLLDYLSTHCSIPVQKPIKTKDNTLVSFLEDGTPVTLLTWIDGDALNAETTNPDIAYAIGEMIGNLHRCLAPLKDYKRYYYDQQLVDKMQKEIMLAYQEKHLNKVQTDMICKALTFVRKKMNQLDSKNQEKVLVHNDFGLSNLIINQTIISPIDFSLCGYGYYQMDLASLVANLKGKDLRQSAINGFEDTTGKKVNIPIIETFFAFSVLLFIAFQHEKVYKEEWFQKGMAMWDKTIFKPLLDDTPFLFEDSI